MQRDTRGAYPNAAEGVFRTPPIILIKSGLLGKAPFADFAGLVAPPSRAQMHSSGVHRRSSHAVWRRVSTPSLLSAARIAPTLSRPRALRATQQYLQHPRDVVGLALSDSLGVGTSRDDRLAARQRRLPASHGIADVSQPHHFASLPASICAARTHQALPPPRSFARATVATSQAFAACHLRHGLNDQHGVHRTDLAGTAGIRQITEAAHTVAAIRTYRHRVHPSV